jgi:7,8-dihydropterin-6-yl-methyl-4-(beta-D-ribofuranosyl)aminobenzene 5'-phosphate synthase
MEHTKKTIEQFSGLHKVGEVPAGQNTITITTLVDNIASGGLASEHGLSFWLKYNGKHILFDTGQSNIILKNANLLGIDLTETNAIIISHGHYDHTGGLNAVLDIAPKATLYLHPEALGQKFSRKSDSIKTISMPEPTKKMIHTLAGQEKAVWTEKPTEILPGLFATGKIPRKTNFEDTGGNFFANEECTKKDELLDDQAIFTETRKGIVILLGCAHSGVVNTLDYVAKLTGQNCIYAVIGGMHLLNASDERMSRTIDAFKKYKVQKISPAHCTGSKAVEKIRAAFPNQAHSCYTGSQISL